MNKTVAKAIVPMMLFVLSVPFISSAAIEPHSVFTLAEGWERGPLEEWQLIPVNEKNVFTAGEKVQFFAQVGPIYDPHQWRLELFLNNEPYREAASDIFTPDPKAGWNYSNFIPYATDLPPGEYWVQYYLAINGVESPMDGFGFEVLSPGEPYVFHHAVAARGFEYGTDGQYWNLMPVGAGNIFQPGEKVYFMVQVGNIYLDHSYKAELYRGDVKILDYNTEWLDVGDGWEYGNFYPYYENIPPGDYVFKAYIELGEGFMELASVPFTVTGPAEDYYYSHTVTSTGFVHGPEGREYWNLVPVGASSVFEPGQTVYAMSQVTDIFRDHRWKAELYRNGRFLWEQTTDILQVNTGWEYGNFYPFYANAQPGEYEWKVYIDTGAGFQPLDAVSFSVAGPNEEYIYAGAVTAEGWEHGPEGTEEFWDIRPVGVKSSFSAGEDAYLVAQLENVFVDHRWGVQAYRDGELVWEHQTDVVHVGSGYYYSNFHPFNENSIPGEYVYRVFLDTGSGFMQIDEVEFSVMQP